MHGGSPDHSRLITKPFLAVTMAALAFFLYVGVLVPIVPTYVEDELRGGELGIGLAIASFAVAAIAARPLITRLIDQHGRRAVMIGGALLAAVSGAMYGFADSLPVLLALRGVTGVGEASMFVAAATLVTDLAPAHRRAEAMSYFSVAVYTGIGIGPVIGEAVLHDDRFRTAFVVAAGFAVLAAVVACAVPASVARPVPLPDPVPAGSAGGGLTIDLERRSSSALVHPAAIGPGALLAVGTAAFAVFSGFIPDYSRELGLKNSGAVFFVYSVTCLVLRIVGARVPERVGARASVTTTYVLLTVAFGGLALVRQAWVLWAAAVLIGVGMAFMYPALMALTVNRASERERSRAVSSFTMFYEVGAAVGGLLLGGLADVLGKRVGFAGTAVLCVGGTFALWRYVLPPPAPASTPSALGTSADERTVPATFVPAGGD
ncbi:MFS transporter [soil metagenome]